ncbi:MAG: hypothetical protein J6X28_03605 [Bacilli bacterium]|nr:hypothetical protein [Bacilli bacterium]
MNIRKIAYGLLCLSFVLLFSGGFSSFLASLRNDHQQVLRRMDDVSGTFESFSTKTTHFEEFRDELYTEVLGNVYYDTMFVTDEKVKETLTEYEGIVDDITKDARILDGWCGNVYYPEATINNMCINYKSIYEQVINYYVTDIHTYNENVQKYNEYQSAIQSTFLVDPFQTKYQYIDYNHDNTYDGRE